MVDINIPNIFHFIHYHINDNIIKYYEYLCINSVININKPCLIYIHFYKEPNGKLWDILNNSFKSIILIKIDIPERIFNKYKKALIYKILYDYGGIYLEFETLLINQIILKNKFIKSNNDEIIGSIKQLDITYQYFEYYQNNPNENNLHINLENSEFNMNYNTSNDNINIILFKEIHDYSFGIYFHLVNNCYIFSFYNKNIDTNILDFKYIFNKITTYNLLVRNSIVNDKINLNTICNYTDKHVIISEYNLYDQLNEKIVIKNNLYGIEKFNLINNIDIIYWINLEKSYERRNNMLNLLGLLNVKNSRIIAFDGEYEQNISSKYFYSENGVYPKYSNKEYAILLSHLNSIEKFTNLNDLEYNIGLICEDDLSFDFINYWNYDIRSIIQNAPNDWDIIMLGYFTLNLNFNDLYKKWDNEWSAISYLVNHNSMKMKINKLKKDNKWICNENDLMVSDNYIFSKFNTYVYKYPYFTYPNNNNSTLHEDHLLYHRIYKISNYITLENIRDTLIDI
jgi:hypothetical protein